MSHREISERRSITRRRVLAASGTAILASVAGCSAVVDFIGEQVLEEVNVLNQLNREVSGSIEVIGPGDDTVLEDSFDVPSVDSDGESNVVAYDDVWTDSGEYQVSVELEDVEIENVSQATETVRIEDTDEEMVGVSIGSGEEDEPIAIRVGESLSEFGQTNESG